MEKNLIRSFEFLVRKRNFAVALTGYMLVQCFLIIFARLPFFSDSLSYYNIAQNSIAHHSLYPGIHNLYDDYIFAPIYVNYLIVLLSIHNSMFTILISNVILNTLQLFLLMKIARLIFRDDLSAKIAGSIYIIYFASLGAVLMNITELFFGVLSLSGFYFYLKKGKINFIIAGILIAFSIGVRQIGFVLFAALLINETTSWFSSKKLNKEILILTASLTVTLISFGIYTKAVTGYFIISGNNEAVNILMGANDFANGTYKDEVFKKGKAGFIPNDVKMTFVERSDYWDRKAWEWIKKNPVKWVAILPYKIFHTFAVDDWSIFMLANTTEINSYKIAKNIYTGNGLTGLFGNRSVVFVIWFVVLYAIYYTEYYVLLFLIGFVLFKIIRAKDVERFKLFLIPYLYSILGLAATFIAVGAPRYKYPYIIILILTVVPIIKTRIEKIELTK